MGTRREFLTQALWTGGATMAFHSRAFALFGSTTTPLIEPVRAACKRLAAEGWRDLLLSVSDGALDIGAADLAAELNKPLSVDRARAGTRGQQNGRITEPMIRRHLMALRAGLMVADGAIAVVVFMAVAVLRFRDGNVNSLWRALGIEPILISNQPLVVERAIGDFTTSLWQAIAIMRRCWRREGPRTGPRRRR